MYSPKKAKIDFIDLSLLPTRKKLVVNGRKSDPIEIMIASNFMLSRNRKGDCRLKIPTSHGHFIYVSNWKTGITPYKIKKKLDIYLKKGFLKKDPGYLHGERSNINIYVLTKNGEKYFSELSSLLVLGNPYN